MSLPKRLKKFVKLFALLIVAILAFELWMMSAFADKIVSVNEVTGQWGVVIVPGASVLPSGKPSDILADRLLTAKALYHAGVVEKFLLSGDHGESDYDEVTVMRDFLLDRGVSSEDIFLDHAGFDTYDTLYRASEVFGVRRAIVTSQEFHLPRVLYIARGLEIEALGVEADRQTYLKIAFFAAREWPARLKAWWDLTIRAKPEFLGQTIPLTGSGQVTWDDVE